MVPFELESSTEKDSRMLWRSCGGSLERLSFWENMPFETSLRGSLLAPGFADRDEVSYFAGDAGCERRTVGDGGGSVCALANLEFPFVLEGVESKISSSSSSSDTVYACLSFDGEVIGDAPLRFVGGVAGLPLLTKVGEPGEPGRRNGDDRGELLKVDLYEDCGTTSVAVLGDFML